MVFKIITLGLMAVFYISYFVKMISQRKQGIGTDQLGKGKNGFVKFIEVTLKISTYVLPVIQIISILWYIGTSHIILRIIGCVITAVGVFPFADRKRRRGISDRGVWGRVCSVQEEGM